MNPYEQLKVTLEKVNPELLTNIKELEVVFELKKYEKGDYFTKQGDKDLHIAFIVKGLFRYFYLTPEGDDVTKLFSKENEFISSYAAMLYGRPSTYSIVAEEDSEILVIDRKKYIYRITNDPKWERIARLYAEETYNQKELREASFLLEDAATRYKKFLTSYPNVEKRVKQKHIATYLGINPVSLSRIKKQNVNIG